MVITMELFAQFFVTALTAVAVENAVFARALGINKTVLFMKSPKMGILYGAVLTWMGVLSSFLVAIVNVLLEGRTGIMYIRAPLFSICVAAVYIVTYLVAHKWKPKLFQIIKPALPVCTFNTALFGAFYISSTGSYHFLQTVGYTLGTGVGYTLALLVIYFARKRLAISPVPRSFRGLPILLLYIGLLSLAIYGLLGHGLPS